MESLGGRQFGQISHVLGLEGTIDPTVTFSVTLTHSS
jgi:hypothetical protein